MGPQDRDVSIQREDPITGTFKVPYASLNNSIDVYSFQYAIPKQTCGFKMNFLLPQPLEEKLARTSC